ncbi:hypothetical protein IKE99_01080 [Candidatus Saccharibacteria bacterium]|nr:hypothetical protein [Candidatus Saccharibacteria bacterium]
MKKLLFSAVLILSTLFIPTIALVTNPAYAAVDVCFEDVPQEVKDAAGCSGNSKDDLSNAVQDILKAIVVALGVVAAVFIVIGAINYITSNGDSGKIEKAKKTIIYAAIGLAVSALAFAIVNWAVSIIPQN